MEPPPDPAEDSPKDAADRPTQINQIAQITRFQRTPRLGGAEPARDDSPPDPARAQHLADLDRLMGEVRSLSARIIGKSPASSAGDADADADDEPPPAPAAADKPKRRDKSLNRPQIGRPGILAVRRAAPPSSKPKRKRAAKRYNPLALWVAAQAFGFSLVALGYLAGQWNNSGDGAVSSPGDSASGLSAGAGQSAALAAPSPSREVFQKVNAVMLVGKSGDADAARRLLLDAQRTGLAVPGADYRLALLALQRGDVPEARLRLQCAAAANQQRAACGYVNAMLAGAAGDYRLAAQTLEESAYADPFSARYLFFWGETLRRAGRSDEAVERLEQALLRPCSPREADYIAFKLRLAKIEAGRDKEFAEELNAKLQSPAPEAAWLLTAAAREAYQGERAAAKRYLQTAADSAASAEDFAQPLRDFFFAAQFSRQELAAYLSRASSASASAPAVTPVSAASPKLAAINADPASWTLQAADPGAWPSL